MDRPLPDLAACVRRRQALLQARSHPAGLPAPGRPSSARTISFDLVRREDARASAAPPSTARCSGWSDAGIARKVDFGEGRSRFEPSYRHPRHFHLICTNCHRSSEFLSSDVEALHRGDRRGAQLHADADASSRSTAPARSAAPASATPPIDGATTELVFARDALRMAIATERSGLEFYTRAAGLTKDPRGRIGVSEAGRRGEGAPRHARDALRASCSRSDPQLESRPTFLFFKGAASGLFAEGAEQLRQGVERSARRCSSASSASAARTSSSRATASGSRTPEGKQIFLEFADEERAHLDLLMREYRALRERQSQAARGRARTPRGAAPGDRSAHPHHRLGRPLQPAELRRARRRGRRHRAERHRPRHRGRVRSRRRAVRRAPASRSSPASRSPRCATSRTSTCSATSSMPARRAAYRFSRSSASGRIDRVGRMVAQLDSSACRSTPTRSCSRSIDQSGQVDRRGRRLPARSSTAGYVKTTNEAFAPWLSRGRPGFVAREARAANECSSRFTAPAASRRWRIPGCCGRDEWIDGSPRRSRRDRGVSLEPRRDERSAATGPSPTRLGLVRVGRLRLSRATNRTARHPGSTSLPQERFDQLRDRATSRATASGASDLLVEQQHRSRRSARRSSPGSSR